MDVTEVLADLRAEQLALDDIVADLAAEQWQLPTPSPGWNVADQIGHLTYFDRNAALAITDPAAFQDAMHALLSSGGDDMTLGPYRAMSPDPAPPPGAPVGEELASAAATLANDTRIALVRTLDGIEVVPHRAADGGLGTRPGRRRRRRGNP